MYNIIPPPKSLMTSFRSIGYDLKTSVADLMDNSISADAKNIRILYPLIEKSTPDWIAILDDGKGMDKTKLGFALTPGKKRSEREGNDLGRFGLGLKTASLSQCKKFTIITKASDEDIIGAEFDLNNLSQWQIPETTKLRNNEIINRITPFLNDESLFNDSFTLVFWEEIDNYNISSKTSFRKELELVRKHVSLVFQKYTDINFFLNTLIIRKLDIFASKTNNYSQQFEEKKLKINDNSKETFNISGRVLKHESEFKDKTTYSSLFENYSPQQFRGIFVFRNRRLIHFGSWLGLFKVEPHYNSARIEINISNSLESDVNWRVDISKSDVKIPDFAKSEVKKYITPIRKEANETIGFHGGNNRGRIINRKRTNEITPIWNSYTEGTDYGSKKNFELNIHHPIIKAFSDKIDNDSLKHFENVLIFIQNNLPTDAIYAAKANNELVEFDVLEKLKTEFQINLEFMVNAAME